MKRTFIVITLAFVAFCLNAQKPMATFFSEDGYKFWVVMDGKRMNPEPEYRVENIPMENDWAKVKIIFEDANLEPLEKTIQGVDVDGNPSSVTWVIKQNKKGKWKVTASSWKALEAEEQMVQKPMQTEKSTESTQPAGQTKTVTTQTTTTTADPNVADVAVSSGSNGVSMKIDINDNGQAANMDINMNMPGTQTEQESSTTYTTVTTTTTTYEDERDTEARIEKPVEKPNPLPGYNGRVGCDNNPMSADSFSRAKKSIAGKDFEDSKMTVAKQVIKANCLLVSQVKEIMQLFTYEDDKLDFAIEAYPHTYDIDNYYELNDVFTFESSIEELNDALGF